MLKVTCLLPGVQWKLLQRKTYTLLLFLYHSFVKNYCARVLLFTQKSWAHLWPCTAQSRRTHRAATKLCLTGSLGMSMNPLKHQWDCVPTSRVLSRWLWGYEVNNMHQISSVLMLTYNTVQNKMEFTFKIKTLCSYVCTEDTAGEENARYTFNERHYMWTKRPKICNKNWMWHANNWYIQHLWKIRAFISHDLPWSSAIPYFPSSPLSIHFFGQQEK